MSNTVFLPLYTVFGITITYFYSKGKGKVVPLHAMEALWVRGGMAPTLF
jgi:hypothetical protein